MACVFALVVACVTDALLGDAPGVDLGEPAGVVWEAELGFIVFCVVKTVGNVVLDGKDEDLTPDEIGVVVATVPSDGKDDVFVDVATDVIGCGELFTAVDVTVAANVVCGSSVVERGKVEGVTACLVALEVVERVVDVACAF